MSVHINIRIPDELAARIDERSKAESMSQTAVIVNWLWAASSPTVIQAPPLSPEVIAELQKAMDAQPHGKITAIGGMRDSPKRLKVKRALGRTPENLSLADNRDARPAHAPGCKCLMCQGK
jgi:hypothetical protein